MKKNRISLFIMISAVVIAVMIFVIIPSVNDYSSRRRVYADMQMESDEIFDANINIIDVTTDDNSTSYGTGSSGAVIRREESTYYALTAYHVVRDNVVTYYILTPETPTYQELAKTYYGDHLPLEDYYASLPEATVEYTKKDSDLAIISFESDADLPVAVVSDTFPRKGDRVMVISNPEGEKFRLTYGKVLSSYVETTAFHDNQFENMVIRHSAYEAPGSSGSAVYNENMELAGINIGGVTDVFGRFRYGYMIPCDQVQECIDEWTDSA